MVEEGPSVTPSVGKYPKINWWSSMGTPSYKLHVIQLEFTLEDMTTILWFFFNK